MFFTNWIMTPQKWEGYSYSPSQMISSLLECKDYFWNINNYQTFIMVIVFLVYMDREKAKWKKKTESKLQANISHEYRHEILNKILANSIQQCLKRVIHHDHMGLIPEMQAWISIQKLTSVIYHISRLVKKILQDHNWYRKSIWQHLTPIYN